MNAKEFFDSVLPSFLGTWEEQIRAITQHCAETHEQWVKDIEAREALEPHFEA